MGRRKENILEAYRLYAKLRDERGMTDYEVSKETGIAAPTLSAWKSQEYMPKADKISKIAKLFNEPIENFLRY